MLINLGMLIEDRNTDGVFTQSQDMQDDLHPDLTRQVNLDFISRMISDWENDPRLSEMMEGQRYYENHNDIMERRRHLLGKNAGEDDWLTNNRLSHSFLRKLVRQKIGYLLGKPVTVTSDDSALQETLTSAFDKAFQRTLKATATNAIVQGLGWLQAYYDADGQLRFKRIPGSEVIPFWADSDHTELDAVIRVWETASFSQSDVTRIRHASFYTTENVWNFVQDEDHPTPGADGWGEWRVDDEAPVETNFTITAQETDESGAAQEVTRQGMWNRVPFIPIKYSPEEQPLLRFVKDLIDDYDKRTSDLSNTLEEEPDKIKIVRNYDGTDKKEFIHNLYEYRAAFIRDNGDITTLDTSISADAASNHLDRLRQDIYEFGSGVDTQNKDLGNASGVALRFIYSDLDMDCQIFQGEISWALDQVVWFIQQDMILKGTAFSDDANTEYHYSTSMIINETERVASIKNSVGILSDKTLISNHPFVEDTDAELEQIRLEDDAKAASINDLYGFNENQQVSITQNQGDDTVTQTLSGASEAGKILGEQSAQASKDSAKSSLAAPANASLGGTDE